ncbi:hypothetical protein JHK85_053135 [Glycine max]|nr:hypothetical protein JHK85_053135 [Glycine max]
MPTDAPQQQAKSMHALRMHSPTERHMMMHGGNGSGDSGLVLSTDAKPRLKWTPDLHERFIEAVNELGGATLTRNNPQSRNSEINDALQMQIELQRRLHEQLEV